MKKLLTCAIVFALTSGAAMAQSGNWYVGGALGAASKTHTDKGFGGNPDLKTKNLDYVIAPEIGTFLSESIQLGFALGLSGATSQRETEQNAVDVYTIKTKSMGINPTIYARKFWSLSDNFSVFAGLYLTAGSGHQTQEAYTYNNTPLTSLTVAEQKTKLGGFGARLGVGIAYALSDRFTAVGQYGLVGFTSKHTKDQDGNTLSTDTSVDFGVNTVGGITALAEGNGSGSVFNIGLYYTFIKK